MSIALLNKQKAEKFKEAEELLKALSLCDPITTKGKEDLHYLKTKGLRTKVTPNFFYANDKLRVPSIYEDNRQYEEVFIPGDEQHGIFHEYTFDKEQYDKDKCRHRELMAKISGTTLNDPVFIFQGVTGNGKSIEINRLIRQHNVESESKENNCLYILFDFEEATSSIERGHEFAAWNDSIAAVFCVSIFSGVIKYIEELGSLRKTVLDNYEKYLKPKSLCSYAERRVIEKVGEFTEDNPKIIDDIFSALKEVTAIGDADTTIIRLLRVLMWVMFCTEPYKQYRIVVDNIENYIILDENRVQIPDEDIGILYKAVRNAVNKMNLEIKTHFGMEKSCFAAFFVVRRTTLGLLDKTCLHQTANKDKIADDLTGHFQFWEIWEKKRSSLWTADLENVIVDEEYKTLVAVMDIITAKGTNTVGKSYQSLISSLMNYGIRRIGYAEAHAACMTCIYLLCSTTSDYTMGYERFKELMANAESNEWTSARYMARRALLEIQFKWSASQETWKYLQIGYVGEKEKEETVTGIENALITRPLNLPQRNISLVSRILSFLSYHHCGTCATSIWEKAPSEMFDTVSLYDLVRGILIPPYGRRTNESFNISETDYRFFATSLLALANMDSDETKTPPYIILNVDDNDFHSSENAPEKLAEILNNIAHSNRMERKENGKYDSRKFNARITDAGYCFLHWWLHSFSYMAAISCYTIPPLFFLNNYYLIAYVIKTVYEKANEICMRYEKDAFEFLKNNEFRHNSLMGLYARPSKKKGCEATFRQLVKKQHLHHLDLYRQYLEQCYKAIGLSEKDKIRLVDVINKYRDNYTRWGGEKECF